MRNAISDSNNSGLFPGADRIFVEAGEYGLASELSVSAVDGDLELIGEGAGTEFVVQTNGIIGVRGQSQNGHDLELSGFRVEMIGFGSGYAVFGRNALYRDIEIAVTATVGSARAFWSLESTKLEDSKLTLTGSAVSAGYSEDNLTIKNVVVNSVDGNSNGFALSDGSGLISVDESNFHNVRSAVTTDSGLIDVRDTFIKLSDSSGAVGISAENGNDCGGCNLLLTADNVTVVGFGPNQAGAAVAGTASNDAFEYGGATVVDSLFHLTGSGSLGLRCTQFGPNTTAEMTTIFVATDAARIQRTGSCSGTDTSQLDTTSSPPQFTFTDVGDFRPTASSPIVDAADPTQFVPPGAKDADGLARQVNGRVDIGAHEFQSAMKPSPIKVSATPDPANVGQLIDFEAVSHEPDGGAVGFAWDFGDGNSDTGDDPQHSYAGPGDYTVTVTATDNELDFVTTTRKVHVSSDPPTTPTIEADKTSTFRSEAVEFTASGSTDLSNDYIHYEWSFTGGGTATSVEDEGVIRAPTNLSSPGPTIYTATVKAVDQHGEESPEASVNVTVYNRMPDATAINSDHETRFRGEPFEFWADADDAPEHDVIFRSWDFDDGAGFGAYSNEYFWSKTYDTVGVKTISVKVRDGYYEQAGPLEAEDSMTRTVEVLNREPVVGEIVHSGSLKTGDRQAFSIVASEPEGDPLSYSWIFGDGATGQGASASHSFATPGTYSVTLTVSDGQGATLVKRLPVVITAKRARIAMAKPAKNFKSVKLTASEAVGVTFTVLKTKGGFRKGSRCAKKGAGKRCDLKLAGSLKKKLAKGTTNVSFKGKWRGKKLPKGSYKLVATPADGGPVMTVPFRIR